MSQQGSFSMKSTHRFVTNDSETDQEINEYSTLEYTSSTEQQKTTTTDTESQRKKGSTEGMAIRTTSTSQEDFY